MFLFIPIAIGAVIGVIVLFLTKLLRNKSAFYHKLPSVIAMIGVVILLVVSFDVRGFEGASYAIVGITILIFSIVSFTKSIKLN
ncbi:YesK family protein [Gracilibacillus salinarum]|uniref:YesK-like protein n=1 Tax=Gracilibacillus salinarum TaxID=2932255 RepID=A0ABY4GMV9_9BACI|nr:YesK family protein [Gracilibacillus salinarum]UOQ85549.1 hypothetical protein MUN87_01190 [Gracilibacillus salinarum]